SDCNEHRLTASEEVAHHPGHSLAPAIADLGRRSRTRATGGRITRQLALDPRPEWLFLAEHAEGAGARAAQGLQDDPWLHRAVPAVALEADGQVTGLAVRGGERAGAGPEGDPPGARGAGDQREARMLAFLAHAGHCLHSGGGHEQ